MNLHHHLNGIGCHYSILLIVVVVVFVSPPGMKERDFESFNVHFDEFKVGVVQMSLHLCQRHDFTAHHVWVGAFLDGWSRYVLVS